MSYIIRSILSISFIAWLYTNNPLIAVLAAIIWGLSGEIAGYFKDLIDQAKQIQIDCLMLEYCPDQMTLEQCENWANHQISEKQSCSSKPAP